MTSTSRDRHYKIFRLPDQRHIMGLVSSPRVDSIVHSLSTALQDRNESEEWLIESIHELTPYVGSHLVSELRSTHIDHSFCPAFSPSVSYHIGVEAMSKNYHYRIFKLAHQRKIMHTVSSPEVDRIVKDMHAALIDREEAEDWFWSSLNLLHDQIKADTEQDHDEEEAEVLLEMVGQMIDEMKSSAIDHSFCTVFNPLYDLRARRPHAPEEYDTDILSDEEQQAARRGEYMYDADKSQDVELPNN